MKTTNLVFSLSILSLFALASCSGGGGSAPAVIDPGGGGGGGGGGHGINCGGPDTDGDKLPDCYEEELGTSIVDPDTDGDNLSDYEEVVVKAFDAETNNYQFNPRIADVPQLSFVLTSVPNVEIDYTKTDGTESTVSSERTDESATTVTTSETTTESVGVEVSSTASTEFSLDSFGGSYSTTATNNWEQSFSYTQEQSRENRRAYTRGLAETSRSDVTQTGGSLTINFQIRNRGYQDVTLTDLVVSAQQTDPHDPSALEPIGNLRFDDPNPIRIGIAPNGTSSDKLIFTRDLPLGRALALLKSSDNLVLEASTWRAEDDEGRSFTHNLTNIGAKDATVVIDYGPRLEKDGREKEIYYVSTVGDFDNKRVSAREALEEILRVPYQTGTAPWNGGRTRNGLLSVRDIGTDAAHNGHWLALYVHTTNSGADRESKVYDNLEEAYDFDRIELRKGYVLHLVYVEDRDGDEMASREEFMQGTRDDNPDTDGDKLWDNVEVREGWEIPVTANISRTVFSDPLEADADEDGLEDLGERMNGSDPYKRDTDGDGTWDLADSAILPQEMHERAHIAFNASIINTVRPDRPARLWGIEGFPSYGLDRNGNRVGALILNGEMELEVPGFESLVRDGFTFSFWFKAEDLKRQGLLRAEGEISNIAMWMYERGSVSTNATHSDDLLFGTGQGYVEEDTWHHVVGVISDEDDLPGTGAESYTLYIDGEQVRTRKSHRNANVMVETIPWVFGTNHQPDGLIRDHLRGALDDIRLFRRALDAAEVKLLFNER